MFCAGRSVGWVLVEIGFLWATTVVAIMAFARVSRAALLLVPYLL